MRRRAAEGAGLVKGCARPFRFSRQDGFGSARGFSVCLRPRCAPEDAFARADASDSPVRIGCQTVGGGLRGVALPELASRSGGGGGVLLSAVCHGGLKK